MLLTLVLGLSAVLLNQVFYDQEAVYWMVSIICYVGIVTGMVQVDRFASFACRKTMDFLMIVNIPCLDRVYDYLYGDGLLSNY